MPLAMFLLIHRLERGPRVTVIYADSLPHLSSRASPPFSYLGFKAAFNKGDLQPHLFIYYDSGS